jgi:hypothetical protein
MMQPPQPQNWHQMFGGFILYELIVSALSTGPNMIIAGLLTWLERKDESI